MGDNSLDWDKRNAEAMRDKIFDSYLDKTIDSKGIGSYKKEATIKIIRECYIQPLMKQGVMTEKILERLNLLKVDEETLRNLILSDNNINLSKIDLFVPNKEIIAEQFHKQQPFFYDSIGFFWFWNNDLKCYDTVDEYQLMNKLKIIAQQKNFQITTSQFWTECLRSMKLIGRLNEPKPFQKTWIQFGSKIYDYQTMNSFESSPEYFNVNPISYDLGESDSTPELDKLFSEWVGEIYVQTLYEILAISILQDYPLHRIICLFGSGLNGKGVFLRFITTFIGKRNVCSSNLKKLIASNFEVSKLYKKLVCLMAETDFSMLQDTAIIKQLTGQDLISAEFKGKDSFDFENYATLIIASNSLPITLDKTSGFYRRPLIIDFPNQFPEGKDPLKRIPKKEYNNLCKKLLKIIPSLIERGCFTNDGNIESRRQKYEEKSNPLLLFIEKNYFKDINGTIPFFEFFDKFTAFCTAKGLREISRKNVSSLLDDAGFHTEKKDIKIEGEWKKWVFVIGISNRSNRSNPISNQTTIRESDISLGTIGSNGSKLNKISNNIEQINLKQKLLDCLNNQNIIQIQTIFYNFENLGYSTQQIQDILNDGITKGDWFEPADKKGFLRLL